MASYEALAEFYDALTGDVDYAAWADFYEHFFRKDQERQIHTVLDLACGTGTLTKMLNDRGYKMIGVDLSPEMLTMAMEKWQNSEETPPMFLCRPMQELELPECADACVCCLDAVNYVTDPEDLRSAFRGVHDALLPGGLFIFDIRTPDFLKNLDGQIFLDEDDDVYCVWRADYSEEERILCYGMDLFRRRGKHWDRECEEHEEYAYEPEELKKWLLEAGFESIEIYGNCVLRAPESGEERIVFVGRKAAK